MRKSFFRKALGALGIALFTVAVCVLMLVVNAFLPQGQIHANVEESTYFLLNEGEYPHVDDGNTSSVLDNFTDFMILEESDLLHEETMINIFSCPEYYIASEGSRAEKAARYFSGSWDELNLYTYSRYWMGFRAPMRLLLFFSTGRTYGECYPSVSFPC